MVVDILDYDGLIRGYILDVVRSYYPDMDTSENSPFDDLFIKPMIELLRPFLNKLSRMELKTNLSNAQYLTEGEMNEVGEGNYFTVRNKGSAASTMLTLVFANLNLKDEDFYIKIPTGAIFTTTSGLEFQTKSTIVLNSEAMQNAYNKKKFVYEIDIPITAIEIGSKYNVSAGDIIICKTYFSSSLVSCVNKVNVTDGKDQESNIKYADRIRDFYLSRQLGTDPGYKRFVMDIFEEVTDVYVSGFKDPYMKRDFVKIYNEETKEIIPKHIGGCVDLYLKGCVYDSNKVSVKLNNNIILLDCAFEKLTDIKNPENSIKIYNLTDGSKQVKIKEISAVTENEFFGENTGKVKVVINNKDNISYQDNIINDMKIIYSYISDDKRIDDERLFNVGITKELLASPVISIDSLTDVAGNILDSINERVQLDKKGEIGTTSEESFVVIKNCDEYFNGMPITITYTSNKTLRILKDTLEVKNNRIITADIIGKEANPVPVNVQFNFKVSSIYRNMDKKIMETRIKSSVNSFFKQYKMGDMIEESDLVAWLYTDPSLKDTIQYVELPFKVFYIPKNPDEDIPMDGSQLSSDGVLAIQKIEYPILNASKFRANLIGRGEFDE